MRRRRKAWPATVAGLFAAATAWGLFVSAVRGGAVDVAARLPAADYARGVGTSQTVVRALWGRGRGRVGVSYDGEAVGPGALGVDDRGRVYVLDGVNRRVVRWSAGAADAEFQLPGEGFDDLAVTRDRFVVLARQEERRALVFDESGACVGTLPVSPALGPIAGLVLDGGDVLVRCPTPEEIALHRIGSLKGDVTPLEEQVHALPDAPTPAGAFVRAAKVDRRRLKVELLDSERHLRRRIDVRAADDVSAIVDVIGARDGGAWVAYGVYRERPDGPDAAEGRLVVVRLDEDGALLGRAELPESVGPEPHRKLALSEAGDVYQLVSDAEGVRVLRWTLEQ